MEDSRVFIKARVRESILLEHFRRTGEALAPVAVSNRHVHLSRSAVETLFGPGHALGLRNALFQPGQFACLETVTLRGPRGSIGKVRVLGPARDQNQVEVSVTDCYTLGLPPAVRLSGDIAGTPGIVLEGPEGSLEIQEGVIVAARHLHISPRQAEAYGFREGDRLELRCGDPRPTVLGGVVVRIAPGFELEAHVDTDEANGACLHNDMLLQACLEGGRSL